MNILLEQKLGDKAYLVKRYLVLSKTGSKRNTMPVPNTALASLRFCVSPAAAATIASEFLKDLISAGYLAPEMAYLACDPNKLVRARKTVMGGAREKERMKSEDKKIIGVGYDGRKDRNKGQWCQIEPIHPEKPALKVAQALHGILEENGSVDALQVLQGDSTNSNTGWRGGTHAHLEKLLDRKLFWTICNLHTNELHLHHLIEIIDGPTCSDKWFMGPVCSLLSKVNEMEYNPNFKKLPGGEDLISIPQKVLDKMSTDQKVCYKLVEALKAGHLPPAMQEMLCGPLCHARWLTTAQGIAFLWTRKHGLSGSNLKVLEMLVKFCLESYFNLYFDIKVKHMIVDAPYHILTSLRILKTQSNPVMQLPSILEQEHGTLIQSASFSPS